MVLICVDVSFYIYTTLKNSFMVLILNLLRLEFFWKYIHNTLFLTKKCFLVKITHFYTCYLFQTAYINLTKICNSLNWDIFKVSNFNNRDENSKYFDFLHWESFFFYLVNNNFKSIYFGVNIVNLTVPYTHFEYFSKMIEIYNT